MNNKKFSDNEIKQILKEEYGIEANLINEINRGTADIFKIIAGENKYILKIFVEGRSKESVIKETNIINYLKENGLRVPEYIKTKNEEFYYIFNERVLVLQKFIDGYTMENNTGDYKKTIESAIILGKMTKAFENYEGLKEDEIFKKSFSRESIESRIAKMKDLQSKLNGDNPYKQQFYDDLEFKINVAEELLKDFDFNIIDKMTIKNTHGDYSVQQLIYNDENGTTVIDFETAKIMPIVWEVMRSYSYVDKEAVDGELNIDTLVNYFKEFTKYIKLNNYDLKYAAHLYLIQLIASVFGYKQFNDDYTKKTLLEFALFRTKQGIIKLCREHDTDEDWSSKLTDEQLGINADKWVEKNELLKNECPKYGIRYIDTSKNRNKILQQIVTEIDEM